MPLARRRPTEMSRRRRDMAPSLPACVAKVKATPCRAPAFSLWSLPQYTASLCGLRGEAMMGEIILIAGVDEAGRGPLAGPVTAAAVILDPARPIEGLADSMLRAGRRRGARGGGGGGGARAGAGARAGGGGGDARGGRGAGGRAM